MKKRIVLLCNSCPFGGEAFLEIELRHVPENCSVTLFPLMKRPDGRTIPAMAENVHVAVDGVKPSFADLLFAALHSPAAFVLHGEWRAAFGRKQFLRNAVKALKFAFVSVSRARAVKRCLRKNADGEELVFYSYWMYETAYAAAWLKKQFPGSRFVSRCHGFDLYEHRHENGYLPYRRFLMERADWICPVGEDGRRYLEKLYGELWSAKISVQRLGTEDFGVCQALKAEVPLVVSCSNLVDVKRVDRIIDALAVCGRRIKWVHFGDGPLMGVIRARAQDLPENIEWSFRGAVPNGEIMEFYSTHAVDVFLNVSESEGVPVSIMEALSFGIPVIAADVGGTGEIVSDGENGRLLKAPFEQAALIAALDEILDLDDVRRKALRARARKIWQERCGAEVNFGRFYDRIAGYGEDKVTG